MHGYITLDCRDGQHSGCEVCDCECHLIPQLKRQPRSGDDEAH